MIELRPDYDDLQPILKFSEEKNKDLKDIYVQNDKKFKELAKH